jgi:hypothetical protein
MTRRNSSRAQAQDFYRAMALKDSAGVHPARLSGAAVTPDPSPQGGGEQNLTARVRALYEGSAVPVREIAALAGITERTLYKYAAKQQWKPRYRWRADGGRPRWRRWRAPPHVAPAKGAGGRFIRRAEAGKPVATGIKATAPAARSRAGAACRRAALLAGAAEQRAQAARRFEQRMRAIEAANAAAAALTRYLAQGARQRTRRRPSRFAPHGDALARAFAHLLGVAVDRWERLLDLEAGAGAPCA